MAAGARIKRFIRKTALGTSPVPWANLGRKSHSIARSHPSRVPPLLILSVPRSGSSWVGEIMGRSDGALYLREPITQPYLAGVKDASSFFEVDPCRLPHTYRRSADNAFSGIPAFSKAITIYPSQWKLSDRHRCRPVIKEVNPLACKWLIDTYRPRIIYLIRHPAAVAESFCKMGWDGKQFKSRFTEQTLVAENFGYEPFTASFWSEIGALQAVVLRLALAYLNGYQDSRIVKYEDLCYDPITVFRRLYEFAELQWSSRVEKDIVRHSASNHPNATGAYDVYRDSLAMAEKWKTDVPKEKIAEIKEAYLSFSPAFYREEEWNCS